MGRHWMNELLNLIAGNSRYVYYSTRTQWLALLAILALIVIPLLLSWFT